MITIAEWSISEIALDPAWCSKALTERCCGSRTQQWRVSGIAVDDEVVRTFLVESRTSGGKYRWAPLSDLDGDSVAAAVKERYYAGFETIGVFRLGDEYWALFYSGTEETTA